MWPATVVGVVVLHLLVLRASLAKAAPQFIFRGGFDPVFANPEFGQFFQVLQPNQAQFSGNGVPFGRLQQPVSAVQLQPATPAIRPGSTQPIQAFATTGAERRVGFPRGGPPARTIVSSSSRLSPPRPVSPPVGGTAPTPCITSNGLRGRCVPSSSGLCPGLNSLDSILRQGLAPCRRQGVELYFCCPEVGAQSQLARQQSPAQFPQAPTTLQPSVVEVVSEVFTTVTQDVTLTVTEFVTERPVIVVTETQVVTRTLPDVTVTRSFTQQPAQQTLTPTRPVQLPIKTVAPPPFVPRTPSTARPTIPPRTVAAATNAPALGCGSSDSGWIALIGTRQRWTCSGALVAPQIVLTSARCVAGRDVDRIAVRLGEHDLSSRAEGRTTDVGVSEVIVHPQASDGRNDLALLRLTTGSGIAPICMPTGGADGVDSLTSLRTLGWGISSLSAIPAQSSVLATTPVRRVGAFDCDAAYRIFPTYGREFPDGVGDTEVCVAAEGESAPGRLCPQDRGSPLVGTDARGRVMLVGVMREAAGCSTNVLPALYTHLSPYMSWVRQQEAKLA